ncbi:MAG TPA: hypothetical protein PKL83_03365 [bacterium]|nr:hypothetical protein [bacterium]
MSLSEFRAGLPGLEYEQNGENHGDQLIAAIDQVLKKQSGSSLDGLCMVASGVAQVEKQIASQGSYNRISEWIDRNQEWLEKLASTLARRRSRRNFDATEVRLQNLQAAADGALMMRVPARKRAVEHSQAVDEGAVLETIHEYLLQVLNQLPEAAISTGSNDNADIELFRTIVTGWDSDPLLKIRLLQEYTYWMQRQQDHDPGTGLEGISRRRRSSEQIVDALSRENSEPGKWLLGYLTGEPLQRMWQVYQRSLGLRPDQYRVSLELVAEQQSAQRVVAEHLSQPMVQRAREYGIAIDKKQLIDSLLQLVEKHLTIQTSRR